jgi:hypothetical protein
VVQVLWTASLCPVGAQVVLVLVLLRVAVAVVVQVVA